MGSPLDGPFSHSIVFRNLDRRRYLHPVGLRADSTPHRRYTPLALKQDEHSRGEGAREGARERLRGRRGEGGRAGRMMLVFTRNDVDVDVSLSAAQGMGQPHGEEPVVMPDHRRTSPLDCLYLSSVQQLRFPLIPRSTPPVCKAVLLLHINPIPPPSFNKISDDDDDDQAGRLRTPAPQSRRVRLSVRRE